MSQRGIACIGSHLAYQAYSSYAPMCTLYTMSHWCFLDIFPRCSLGTIFSLLRADTFLPRTICSHQYCHDLCVYLDCHDCIFPLDRVCSLTCPFDLSTFQQCKWCIRQRSPFSLGTGLSRRRHNAWLLDLCADHLSLLPVSDCRLDIQCIDEDCSQIAIDLDYNSHNKVHLSPQNQWTYCPASGVGNHLDMLGIPSFHSRTETFLCHMRCICRFGFACRGMCQPHKPCTLPNTFPSNRT